MNKGKRINFSSGSSFEEAYGYSRAVKVGNIVYLSGTTGYDYATGNCDPDPAKQFWQLISNMRAALAPTGARLEDVVQLVTYVDSEEAFAIVGAELGKVFADIRPANTALVVQFPIALIKVEISAVAVIGCGG